MKLARGSWSDGEKAATADEGVGGEDGGAGAAIRGEAGSSG